MKTTIAAMTVAMWAAVASAEELASAAAGTQVDDTRVGMGFSPAIDVEAIGGVKRFEKGWAYKEQREGGLMTTLLWNAEAPIGVAVDVLESRESMRTPAYAVAVRTQELAVGLRARFGRGRVQFVGGAGLARLEAEATASYPYGVIQTRQAGVGVWYEAGVRMPLRDGRYFVGADVRQTYGQASFREGRLPMGGLHAGVTVGMRIGRGPRAASRVGGAS